MKYKTINILIPYFGVFPNYFQLFLNSCRCNKTIDWTIITDNTEKYNYPENVKIKRMSFGDVQSLIQSKFDFDVVIDSVHKLCEYKPAYGYIFDDLVEGYDYWGYGDVDLIYGDMRKFITEEVLSFDKIFVLGHLSLVRNTEILNKLFMKPVDGRMLYKEAFSSNVNFNFDEMFLDKPNINTIFEQYEYRVFKRNFAADIYTKSTEFLIDEGDGHPEKKRQSFFVWNDGELKRIGRNSDGIYEEEYIYIHLQKRRMKVNIDNETSTFKIIPNSFDNLECSVHQVEEQFDKIRKKHINNQYVRVRFNNLKTKIKQIKR